MAPGRSKISLSAEKKIAETRSDALSGGPRDVLSKCDGDYDNVDNESYSDFMPEIARKTNKTVRHLSSDS
jgi:hypothetical protein